MKSVRFFFLIDVVRCSCEINGSPDVFAELLEFRPRIFCTFDFSLYDQKILSKCRNIWVWKIPIVTRDTDNKAPLKFYMWLFISITRCQKLPNYPQLYCVFLVILNINNYSCISHNSKIFQTPMFCLEVPKDSLRFLKCQHNSTVKFLWKLLLFVKIKSNVLVKLLSSISFL